MKLGKILNTSEWEFFVFIAQPLIRKKGTLYSSSICEIIPELRKALTLGHVRQVA
jgi:hypothetical protein